MTPSIFGTLPLSKKLPAPLPYFPIRVCLRLLTRPSRPTQQFIYCLSTLLKLAEISKVSDKINKRYCASPKVFTLLFGFGLGQCSHIQTSAVVFKTALFARHSELETCPNRVYFDFRTSDVSD